MLRHLAGYFVMNSWHSAETGYEKTICEAVSNELHLAGVVEPFCRRSGTCPGLGEEIRGAPDLNKSEKAISIAPLFLTGLASLS